MTSPAAERPAHDLALVPVLSLEPSDFATRPWPADEDAARHWRACLEAGGLGGLAPLEPGSWLVRAADLRAPEHLARVVAVHLDRLVDPGDGPAARLALAEEALGLPGGLALLEAGRVLLAPGCCCGLEHLEDWQAALDAPPQAWASLWLGHPPASARQDGARLLVRPGDDEGAPSDPAPLALDLAALRAALARARRELEGFAPRLAPAALRWLGPDTPPDAAARVARRLAGLAG